MSIIYFFLVYIYICIYIYNDNDIHICIYIYMHLYYIEILDVLTTCKCHAPNGQNYYSAPVEPTAAPRLGSHHPQGGRGRFPLATGPRGH